MNLENNQQQKDRLLISYILCAGGFFGLGGLHRLYNGKIGTGLLWLCTFGLFYVGQIVDLFLIPNMVDEYEHKLRLKAGVSPFGVPLNQAVVASQVHRPVGNQLMIKLIEAAESKGGILTVISCPLDYLLNPKKEPHPVKSTLCLPSPQAGRGLRGEVQWLWES